MASSKKVRTIWEEHRQAFSKAVKQRVSGQRPTAEDWILLKGLPRTSMLLLGYAVEMYLKAGIAKAYRGCANEMFVRDVKYRFGHKLKDMADELAFPHRSGDAEHFVELEDLVLVDARYPIAVPDDGSYTEAANAQTSRIWSSESYDNLCSIAQRVRDHVSRIDSESSNPASLQSFNIDEDGYLAFRVGGHLPPRITYRLSTAMKDMNLCSAEDVKALFDAKVHHQVLRYWDRAWIYEDGQPDRGKPKTSERKRPSAV
ncbi:hypothetical protein NBRC116596_22440 [Litorivita sp. NS0012-18]